VAGVSRHFPLQQYELRVSGFARAHGMVGYTASPGRGWWIVDFRVGDIGGYTRFARAHGMVGYTASPG
jgi:hypothetical protein